MTVDAYLAQLPEDRREALEKLRNVFLQNLPKGFEETINYGMIGYVVPLSLYPKGYHCDPKQPLPFVNIASQKSHIAVYHMGVYADESLLQWFQEAYPKYSKTKLDMGKSCIRFKKPEQIPYELLAALAQKITVEQWIELTEKNFSRK